ncbi:MAG TPA: VOC family protein [Terriglobia bacterium]|jgi:catechol 2,3-dioxygenase-like lactoylglutathione lyase family enzyme|nr:VOC family protein [Terriglobia bacterium]
MENISRRTFLAFGAGAVITPPLWATEAKVGGFPASLDHILLGCSNLDRGIAFVEEHTGVRAAFGGVHPGRGTQNALISLGERTREELEPRRYLEIIAPDPKQSSVEQYSGITKLKEPRLIGWAVHRDDLEQFAAQLHQEGVGFDGPLPGSRQRPDGKVLHWKALRLKDDHGGLLPFFIEWSADTTHPSVDAPQGCHLENFELLTPDSDALAKTADQLGLGVAISKAAESQIRAVIKCAGKELKLTS